MENIQITSNCLKEIKNFGSTAYQNVCDGSISIVPWGAYNWVVVMLGVSTLVLLFIFLCFLIYNFMTN